MLQQQAGLRGEEDRQDRGDHVEQHQDQAGREEDRRGQPGREEGQQVL